MAAENLEAKPGELVVPLKSLVQTLGVQPTWSPVDESLYLSAGDKKALIKRGVKRALPLPPIDLPVNNGLYDEVEVPLHRTLQFFGGSLQWQGHRLLVSRERESLPASGGRTVSLEETRRKILRLLSGEEGTYGIYLLDLNTMASIGIREQETFFAASTIKVPLNLYLYDLFDKGREDLAQTLTQSSRHYEEGTGVLRYRQPGSRYSLRELARLSIRESDNVATNMLMEHLGRKNFIRFLETLGGKTLPVKGNVTTPRDMGAYLLGVLNLQQRNPKAAAPLLVDMENTVHRSRIPRLLPKDVLVANKIGTWTRAVHDVAIVYHPSRPYILCVFSKNVDPDRGEEVIARISKLVYDDQGRR